MAIDKIKKRNGIVVDFDRAKIENAIAKACIATGVSVSAEQIATITDNVLAVTEQKFPHATPSVEDIQDAVEHQLAEGGLFAVAKTYILYRKEHEQLREVEQEKIIEKIERRQLRIKKRDGSLVDFDPSTIMDDLRRRTGELFDGLDAKSIVNDVTATVYEGVSTKEISKLVGIALRARIEKDQVYSHAGARVLFNDLYKELFGVDAADPNFIGRYRERFDEQLRAGVTDGRLDEALLEYDIATLAQALEPSRDNLFTYLGAQTLYDRYFMRNHQQVILEAPQYFWMRVAMGLGLNEKPTDRIEWVLKFYETISTLRYVPSTPTLFHSGSNHPQMSSCYLTTVEDDLAHIFKCIGDNAQLAKWSGGIGNDWTNIRATGSPIKTTNVGSQGVIPFLKIADATTAAINRSGKRRGAACVYLETWHYDIESFLELRKNTGDDRRRTHDTNTANWIPDLFIQRVMADGDWTLFSPHEVPELHHIYGAEFKQRYEEYERRADAGEIKLFKRIKAKDLWRKMITMLFETGHPWITFKDPSNIRSPQDHVGVVHSSNLCTEITLNTSADETAVCNLGSINLSRHVTDKQLDRDKLQETVAIAIRMLDNVVDLNFYPTKEAQNANLKHRPVGLGIMGLQDALYQMDMNFDSVDAVVFSDETMEFISFHAILGSSMLAKERGAYSSFKGSKWDRNIFPVDTLNLLEQERGEKVEVSRDQSMDWSAVREHVRQYGMRNSNTMAIAPTATISNIAGCLPTVEPIYKNLYVKSNVSGEFTVVNRFLIDDLKELQLWNDEMIEKIKYYDGSIQKITEIPVHLRNKYKEVFEIGPQWIIQHAAHRAKWIDQSQSINIFSRSTSGRLLSDTYIAAWKAGLKTTYYLRTLGASAIEKATLDINKKFEGEPVAKPVAEEPVVIVEETIVAEKVAAVVPELVPQSTVGAQQAEPIAAAPVTPASAVDGHPDDLICEACQ